MKYLPFLLIFLFACSSTSRVTTTSIPVPLNTSVIEQTMNGTADTPELSTIEGTALAACAPLSVEDGAEICNLSVQRSIPTQLGCRQAFISPQLPFPRVTIEVLGFDSVSEAKEKFNWDRRTVGAQNNASADQFSLSFSYDTTSQHELSFLKGTHVVRVTETPKGSCADLDRFTKRLYQKV